MEDLIRREDVLSKLYLDHKDVTYIDKNAAAERIKKIQGIDIVRCKECRYCHRNYVDMTPPYQHDYCYKFSRYMNADDFCSYGERSSE